MCLPNPRENGLIATRVRYEDMMCLTQRLLGELKRPVIDHSTGEPVWERGEVPLLGREGESACWTEHYERNWLDSIAAALDYAKDTRSRLGRWDVAGSVEEHVRISRTTVTNTQGRKQI